MLVRDKERKWTMKRTMGFTAALLLSGGMCVTANVEDAQVNEAAA